MAIFAGGPQNLEGNKIFCPTLYVIIVHSPNPTFMPSLSEIGDLISITSCLVFSLRATAWERKTRRAEEGERSEKDHVNERGVQALCLPKPLAFFPSSAPIRSSPSTEQKARLCLHLTPGTSRDLHFLCPLFARVQQRLTDHCYENQTNHVDLPF